MTKPVITVELDQIDRAGELMLDNRIRHLPVVMAQPDGYVLLVGVISIRDVLRSYVSTAKAQESAVQKAVQKPSQSIDFCIFAKDPFTPEFITRTIPMLCKQARSVEVSAMTPETLAVLDLDGFNPQELEKLFKDVIMRKGVAASLILFDAAKLSPKGRELINQLRVSKTPAGIFKKPVNVMALSGFLNNLSG